jgi:glycosyltransferase involved in cell wall biosynthesis
MKIDFLCNDGSPRLVTMRSVWGHDGRTGVGGSELAMLTLCELWTKKGYRIRLYNDPSEQGVSEFEQLPIAAFNPQEDRDVLIIFRTPRYDVVAAKGLKVWLSFDQFTLRDRPFDKYAIIPDKIVGISEYHSRYFMEKYAIHSMIVIDLPLRVDDFNEINVERIPNRLIFTSVPDRGIMNLHALWPLIKQQVPDASLVITSDYRLWGLNHPNNANYLVHWIGSPDVSYAGAMKRGKYLEELCKADIFLYPHKALNPELFCVSCIEAQYAGAYPVTTDVGALATTNLGTILSGDAENVNWRIQCANKVAELLSDREDLQLKRAEVIKKTFDRFNPETILQAWEDKVFKSG